ncbi:MAG: xanthine dehydrogenase family protein subunit M [Clostridia bacterium]|nr:xanthine dehydrogenase family protein subunit M [Clostridia bacterium]
MRTFDHIDVYSIAEACTTLREYQGRARLNAGGSDLLTVLKGDFLADYPEAVINLKTISGMDYIREDGEYLRIGTLTRLTDLVSSPLLKEKYPVLSEAAYTVATPQIRNVATLGGNLCQDTRCWYYRYPRSIGGPVQCLRKGSGPCLAIKGDNRYHAIMGGKKCFAVCPSDMAVALAALDGKVIIVGPEGERRVEVTDFYHPTGNELAKDEVVREIEIPIKRTPTQQSFRKFTLRKPIDFAIVSSATVITVAQGICTDARIVLGAVAPAPVRAKAAEELLIGKPITEETDTAAAEKALVGAKPLSKNEYKIQIAKTLVKQAILGVTD